MAIYTGVADANGDFNIPFSTNYASGQKVTVTAEKNSATKSIELYAPSEAVGGASISFSGNAENFPANIGTITLIGFSGDIASNSFREVVSGAGLGAATSIVIPPTVTGISSSCFTGYPNVTSLDLPDSILAIGAASFQSFSNCTSLKLPNALTAILANSFQGFQKLSSLIIPDSVISIAGSCFNNLTSLQSLTLGINLSSIGSSITNLSACDEIICRNPTPPTITASTFSSLKSTCVIKVPLGSLSAYQSATNWSVHAAKMVGV